MMEMWIVELLQNEFSGYSFEEIDLALKMNILGEFDKPVEAFNQFSLKYLATLMQQYRSHRIAADKAYHEMRFKFEKPKQIELSQAQKDFNAAKAIVSEFMTMVENGGEMFGLATKYDFLVRMGLLVVPEEHFQTVVNDAKEAIKLQAKTVADEERRRWLNTRIENEESFTLISEIHAKEKIAGMYFLESAKDAADFVETMFYRIHTLHPHLSPKPEQKQSQ
jgi:hypothetical protein